jgi:curved DNA-binding protein CbpA
MNEHRMPIPAEFIGSLIGKKGSNINGLKSTPGIRSLWVEGNFLKINGTNAAITTVKEAVDKQLKEFCTQNSKRSGYIPKYSELVWEMPSNLKVSFYRPNGLPEGNYIVQEAKPDVSADLQDLIARFSIQSQKSGVLFQGDSYPERLSKYLGSFEKEKLCQINFSARFGKTCFVKNNTTDDLPVGAAGFVFDKKNGMRPQYQSLITKDQIDAVREFVLRNGFEMVQEKSAIAIHIIDLQSLKKYVIFVGNEHQVETTISKMTEAVERILKSRDYYQVLALSAKHSSKDLKKSFRLNSLLVHPDKNTHPGAKLAFQILNNANETLNDPTKKACYDQNKYLQIPEDLHKFMNVKEKPKVTKQRTDSIRHGMLSFCKLGEGSEFRILMKSHNKEEEADKEVLKIVEDAWQNRTKKHDREDPDLVFASSSRKLQVETVRYKKNEIYTNENFKISLGKVRNMFQNENVRTIKVCSYDVKQSVKENAAIHVWMFFNLGFDGRN